MGLFPSPGGDRNGRPRMPSSALSLRHRPTASTALTAPVTLTWRHLSATDFSPSQESPQRAQLSTAALTLASCGTRALRSLCQLSSLPYTGEVGQTSSTEGRPVNKRRKERPASPEGFTQVAKTAFVKGADRTLHHHKSVTGQGQGSGRYSFCILTPSVKLVRQNTWPETK